MLVIMERDAGSGQLATSLDIRLVAAVDQNVGDFIVLEQWFERAEADHVVDGQLDEPLTVSIGQEQLLLGDNPADRFTDLVQQISRTGFLEFRWVVMLENAVL